MSKGYIMLYSGISIIIVTFLIIIAIIYRYSLKKKQIKKLYNCSREELIEYIDNEVDKVLDKRKVNELTSSEKNIDKDTEFFNDDKTTDFRSIKTEEI